LQDHHSAPSQVDLAARQNGTSFIKRIRYHTAGFGLDFLAAGFVSHRGAKVFARVV
jgi:hypothetical protein